MTDAPAPGPEVATEDSLHRCITTPDWWFAEENRASTAAFKQPDFSADIASIALIPEYTLRRFPPGCGLVAFKYGEAKAIGYVARQEPDPDMPENLAHANVYNTGQSGGKRKTLAKQLAERCRVLVAPTFPT